MITFMDAKNAEKYHILFQKATNALKDSNALAQYTDIDPDTFEINYLNEYFAFLPDLINPENHLPVEDISHYIRLPLDEDFFEIDANARSIKVPTTSFGRYGVGVEGDEKAEVVYFSIDRYFDTVDLADDAMNIIVQWKTKTKEGISFNSSKEIVNDAGRQKIIFGWPISKELTENAGTIRFAVRFYKLTGTDESENREIEYSLSTLPAEVTVNPTLKYDLLNVEEDGITVLNDWSVLTNRIKKSRVYDSTFPDPGTPIMVDDIHIEGDDEHQIKVVDLNTNGDALKLAAQAKVNGVGKLSYDWRNFVYQDGEYAQVSSEASGEKKDEYIANNAEALEPDRLYYRTATVSGQNTFEPIDPDAFEKNGEGKYINRFGTVYEKISTLAVDHVGWYTVDITAASSVNVRTVSMDKSKGIKVPGPETPVVELNNDLSVTSEDDVTVVHVVTDDGTANLHLTAISGETGKDASVVGENPQVDLNCNWKVLENETWSALDTAVIPGDMVVAKIDEEKTPRDGNYEAALNNQQKAIVVQNGNTITIYGQGLIAYTSTNEYQATLGDQYWLALDIDANVDDIEGLNWNGSELTEADADEAEAMCGSRGHVLYWANLTAIGNANGRQITVGDTTLTFQFVEGAPSNTTYNFVHNNGEEELSIAGLATTGLDEKYSAEIVATRNRSTATSKPVVYRITNAPATPVIEGDAQTIRSARIKNLLNQYEHISINASLPENAQSERVIYLWMKATVDPEVATDIEGTQAKVQVDLDGALADLFALNPAGAKDAIVDNSVATYQNGEIIFSDTNNGSNVLQFNETTTSGYYYCIVINMLNNHRKAAVSNFFDVN